MITLLRNEDWTRDEVADNEFEQEIEVAAAIQGHKYKTQEILRDNLGSLIVTPCGIILARVVGSDSVPVHVCSKSYRIALHLFGSPLLL